MSTTRSEINLFTPRAEGQPVRIFEVLQCFNLARFMLVTVSITPSVMGRASDVLIPARFLFTVGHFVAIVLAFYQVVSSSTVEPSRSVCLQVYRNDGFLNSQDANVIAGLTASPSSSSVASATQSLQGALGLAVICFAIDAFGIFGGYTLFFDR